MNTQNVRPTAQARDEDWLFEPTPDRLPRIMRLNGMILPEAANESIVMSGKKILFRNGKNNERSSVQNE